MFDLYSTFIQNNLNEENKIDFLDLKEGNKKYHDEDLSEIFLSLTKKNNPIFSDIFSDSSYQLPNQISLKVEQIGNSLNFNESVVSEIKILLKKVYLLGEPISLEFSKSEEKEFLIYGKKNNSYHNILIDEDGDIEVLIIPENKKNIFSRKFYKEDGINFTTLINTFNELP